MAATTNHLDSNKPQRQQQQTMAAATKEHESRKPSLQQSSHIWQQLHTTSKQHESKQTIWRLQPKTVEPKPHCATTQLSATPADVTA